MFTTPLKLEVKKNNVVLMDKLVYYNENLKIIVILHEGFISDLASIPMLLKSFVRVDYIYTFKCFILHDALYRFGYDKKFSDNVLDECLKEEGLGIYPRTKVNIGLKLFGSPTDDYSLIDNAHQNVEIIDYSDFIGPINFEEEANDVLNYGVSLGKFDD